MAVVREEVQIQAQLESTQVVRDQQSRREFIGKAWKNITQKGEHVGAEYINVALDMDIAKVEMVKGSRLLLWPNKKREGINEKTGKEFVDADFRVSLVHPEPTVA